MEDINLNVNNTQTAEVLKFKVKSQKNLLVLNSLLWSGLGIVVVTAIAYLYYYVLTKAIGVNVYTTEYSIISGIVSIVMLVIAMITNMKWAINVTEASWGTVISAIVFNVLILSFILAPWLVFVQDVQLIFIALAATGGIMLLGGIIGYCFMSMKSYRLLSIITMILINVVFFGQLIFILTFGFLGTANISMYYFIINIVFLVINVISIFQIFRTMKTMNDIYGELVSSQKLKLSLFFGLELLKSFTITFLLLLRLLSNVSRK